VTRVLLVDDAASVRALLRATLEQSGAFDVVGEAGNGDAAVALAEQLRPDVIVLDLAMPGVDGLTALPELARRAPGATIVVFSEAIGDEETALERGAHAVVHKSDSLDLLLKALSERDGTPSRGRPGTGTASPRSGGAGIAAPLVASSGELRRLIVDTMSEGLVAMGRDGRIVDANPAALRILGRTADDLLGRPMLRDVGLPVDPSGRVLDPTEVPSVRALSSGEAVRDLVMGVETPDRGLRWLSVNAIPVPDGEGSGVAVVSTFSDVTEQREALAQLRGNEQALRKSEEWFRATMETVPDGVVVYRAIRDGDGRIVDFMCEFANGAAAEHQGRPVVDFIGRTLLEHSRGPDALVYLRRYAAVVETGQQLVHEVPRRVNGRIDGAYESQVVKLEDGFLATFRNVTARKRTEQELRTSEQRLFSFLSGLPVGVIVIDLASGPTFVNDRGRELVGRDLPTTGSAADRLAFYRLSRLGSGEPYALHETPVYRSIVTRSTCTSDDVVMQRDDRAIALTMSATPIFDDEGGDITFVIVVFDDITERRESGERLARALADLERSNEELAEFAAVAAHDLSEPLRVVGGFAELVRRKYGDRIEDEGNEWIDHVLGGVSRMRGLIDDLLTYSRAGSAPLARRPVDLSEIVHSVRESLRFAIVESAAVVDVGDLPEVVGDPTQLWQVLQNLFSNALKFRHPDATPHIVVAGGPSPGGWQLSVTDNGIGVPPVDRERIFSPFQRLHIPADRPGTGLGLSNCRRIVERHGGRIWVEAGPEGGSRFCFTISGGPAGGEESDGPDPEAESERRRVTSPLRRERGPSGPAAQPPRAGT
jgi:PAS domain S-box-containing protein